MAPAAYLHVHNSFQKHRSEPYTSSYAITTCLNFIFSMTFTFLGCFFQLIATLCLESWISQLHIPMYCTFRLVVQLRGPFLSALLHIALGFRLELLLPRVRLGQGGFFGTAMIECVFQAALQPCGSAYSSRCYGVLPLQEPPREEIILILSSFSAESQKLTAGLHSQTFTVSTLPVTQLTGVGKTPKIAISLLFLHSGQTERKFCLGKI